MRFSLVKILRCTFEEKKQIFLQQAESSDVSMEKLSNTFK